MSGWVPGSSPGMTVARLQEDIRPKPYIRRDPDISWHSPRGTRASARLRPGAGSPRLVRLSLADAIGSAGPRPQRACPTAPFGTGGAAWPGAPTRLKPGGGRSVQPPPTPSGTEGPAAWPVRAAPGETSSTAPARPAGSRPPPFRPRPISGDPDTPISPAPAVRRDLAFGEGMRGRMGPNGGAGISFPDRRGDPHTLALSPKGRGDEGAEGRGKWQAVQRAKPSPLWGEGGRQAGEGRLGH